MHFFDAVSERGVVIEIDRLGACVAHGEGLPVGEITWVTLGGWAGGCKISTGTPSTGCLGAAGGFEGAGGCKELACAAMFLWGCGGAGGTPVCRSIYALGDEARVYLRRHRQGVEWRGEVWGRVRTPQVRLEVFGPSVGSDAENSLTAFCFGNIFEPMLFTIGNKRSRYAVAYR